MARLINNQLKRPRAIVHTEFGQFLVVGDATKGADVFFCLLLDNVGDVVEGDDTDQAVALVKYRRRHPVVALKQARDLLLVLGCTHTRAFLFHQLGNRHRPFATEQSIKRYGSKEVPALVHHVDLIELVRQFRRFAHVVDGLADIPMRRNSDKFRLHTPAGRILRIFETASDRNAFGRRDLIENLGAFFCRQVLEDRYSVVGFDLAYPLRDRLRGQFIENFLAHHVVDFGKRGEIEIDAEQFNQARPLLGIERLDQRTHVGFMQAADQRA